MSTFFWADTHFNHEGILKLCPARQFFDIEEMNSAIEERWNATVRQNDTIYLIGDFGFSSAKLEPLDSIFSRLRGFKHLVAGNHDEQNPKVMKLPWESVEKLRTVRESGMRAECCHYPLETWKGSAGAIMLHGHCHGSLKRQIPRRFDVGFDVFPNGPVEFSQLWEIAQKQEWTPSDRHGEK